MWSVCRAFHHCLCTRPHAWGRELDCDDAKHAPQSVRFAWGCIERVKLPDSGVGAWLRLIGASSMHSVTSVRVDGTYGSTRLRVEDVPLLWPLRLTELDVGGTSGFAAGLAELCAAEGGSAGAGGGAAAEAGLDHPTLTKLDIPWSDDVADSTMALFSRLRLTELNALHTVVTDDGLIHLRSMPLRALSLSK